MNNPPLRFSYYRAVAPMMRVLVGLSSIELVVLHLLVSAWRRDVAIARSIATLAGMAWLVSAILSFRRLPVTLDQRVLLMRVGTIKALVIPLEIIAAIDGERPRAEPRDRSVLNLALIAHPKVHIDLAHPLRFGRHAIVSVAHRLDDPAAFTSAIERLIAPT